MNFKMICHLKKFIIGFSLVECSSMTMVSRQAFLYVQKHSAMNAFFHVGLVSENNLDICSEEERLSPEIQVPGSYLSSCMYLSERKISLKSVESIITIKQGVRGPGDSVTGRTGVALWNSALILTRLLDEINKLEPSFFNNLSVVELGTGTGLASVAALKFGSSNVIATDGKI